MSGAAGGSRINKENLKATIRDYRDNILKPLGLDKSYNITGVRSRPEKNIFGDIDIVVSFSEGDKKELKQSIASFLEQQSQIPVIPSKNKKYFIHGNIVSTLYPIAGKNGEYVQIDNIVTVSKEEGKFTYKMLDLPAQEQVMAIGLVKAIFTELDEKQIENLFRDLGINNIEKPGEGEEYDFNLNPSSLSLRIVPIGKNEGKEIWKSNNFNDIKTILKYLDIDIEKDKFDTIVSKVEKFKNRRSIDRLKGMFKKNIRVGDAEVGTEKGNKKQQALDTIASLEEKYNPLIIELIKSFILEDESKKTIAIFPGKFKPPHKDHLARMQAAAKDADEVLVLISPKSSEEKSDEQTITAEQSEAIFNLYKSKGLVPNNVKILSSNNIPFKGDNGEQLSFNSPVKSAYEIMDKVVGPNYIAVFGKEEDLKRFGRVPPNVTVKNYSGTAGNLSATDFRKAIKDEADLTRFLPDGIEYSDFIEAFGIKKIEELSNKEIKYWALYADIFDALKKNPDHMYEVLRNKLTGEKLEALEYFYKFIQPESLQENCGCQHEQPVDFKSALASLTKYMVDKGMNIAPLPKLKIIKNDVKNASNILGKTAYYDPNNCSITLYTYGRHPKDILRSYAHEMIHRIQDNEGRLNHINTTNTNEGGDLDQLEREAYEYGNMTLRNWEDSIKNEI